MKSFFLLFVVVICCAITNAQAPPNDNACQATQLTVGTVCNYQTFTTENATSSAGSIAPNCANFISGTTADVWFKVTVPASGGLVLNTQAGVVTDGGMAVYRSSATCIALTFLACNDSSVANGDMPALTITGQTPGATLYIRFWEKGSDNDGTFGICATDIPASPPNDEPCNAIQLTAGTTCAYQTFTNAYASNTTSIAAPVCGGFLGGDVWFKTTMPASGGLLFDTQTGSVTDGGMAVYTGTDCGNISQIYLACDDNSSANGDMPSLFITDQAPGTTLWVRFWENGNNNNGTFGICVTNVQTPPPSNDEPCSAIELPAETNCNYQVFTNLYATATNNIADPPCANYTGGDVWFKVAMPAGSAGLLFDTQAGDITDGGMAVYSGAACSNLTLIACDDDFSSNGPMPSILVSNTASYDTLWVRFWEHGGDNNGTFSVCVKNLPATANDDPCNAIQLGVDTVCHYQTFTTENATASPGVPLPDCANYAGGDVWFKVTVPVMGSMVFDTQQGDIVDGGMAVYSGTNCDSLTFIACDDDASTNGQMPMLAINHQPVGSTLWVRFWEYGNDSRGTFSICVKSIEFPVNDEPCNAIELTADSVSNYQYFTNLNATVSWSVGFPLCANVNDDVWFKVTVPAGGSVLIDTKEGDIADGGMAVYAGTRCDSLTYLGCDDNASVNGRMPALVVDNQAPGTTLWIRFWRNGALGGNDGTFGIGVNRSSPLWTNVTYTKYPVDFGNVIQFSDSSTT